MVTRDIRHQRTNPRTRPCNTNSTLVLRYRSDCEVDPTSFPVMPIRIRVRVQLINSTYCETSPPISTTFESYRYRTVLVFMYLTFTVHYNLNFLNDKNLVGYL